MIMIMIAVGSQLHTIFNITRVSFLSHIVERPLRRVLLALESPLVGSSDSLDKAVATKRYGTSLVGRSLLLVLLSPRLVSCLKISLVPSTTSCSMSVADAAVSIEMLNETYQRLNRRQLYHHSRRSSSSLNSTVVA